VHLESHLAVRDSTCADIDLEVGARGQVVAAEHATRRAFINLQLQTAMKPKPWMI
jgi:hypothetical protein